MTHQKIDIEVLEPVLRVMGFPPPEYPLANYILQYSWNIEGSWKETLTLLASYLRSFTALIPWETHLSILLLPNVTSIIGIIVPCVQTNSAFTNLPMITAN